MSVPAISRETRAEAFALARMSHLLELPRGAVLADPGDHVGQFPFLSRGNHVGHRLMLFLAELLQFPEQGLKLDLVPCDGLLQDLEILLKFPAVRLFFGQRGREVLEGRLALQVLGIPFDGLDVAVMPLDHLLGRNGGPFLELLQPRHIFRLAFEFGGLFFLLGDHRPDRILVLLDPRTFLVDDLVVGGADHVGIAAQGHPCPVDAPVIK